MKTPNRLINEKSPYLKMHAYNPVDWYPWSEEAFDKAIKENKPVFLSIGYSSCHWCHVMEKESFEDEEVASFLNKYFVSIKVDKEERPDIDSLYMEYCVLLNNSGGWPLSVFLTPTKEPFFAGTYFPKASFLKLLQQIKDLWDKDSKNIIEKSKRLVEHLKQFMNSFEKRELNESFIDKALFGLANRYDEEFGGFSEAPKFPSLHNVLLLLKSQKQLFQDMALSTLLNMRRGGIWDHVGGGFHRYSTDRYWLLPHFEKMLYDQAMAILAYSEAYRLKKNEIFKDTVYKTINFVKENLYENGFFYTSMDADTEGEEGGFYLWTYQEIKDILKEKADKFIEFFNIKKEGNFLDEAKRVYTGKNVLYAKEPSLAFEEELKILKAFREKRKKPFIDNKILLDQNAMMDFALIEAYLVFDDKDFLDMAIKNLNNISKHPLQHALNHNKLIEPMLDDYAYLIKAYLSLYKATFSKDALEKAISLTEETIEKLWDKKAGGFYLSVRKDVLIPQKTLYDGAIPSGNSVMGLNLVELFFITKEDIYENRYQILSSIYYDILSRNPTACSFFMTSFLLYKKGYQILLSMPISKAQERVKELYKHYLPNIVPYHEESSEETFIACKDYTCLSPVKSVDELIKTISL